MSKTLKVIEKCSICWIKDDEGGHIVVPHVCNQQKLYYCGNCHLKLGNDGDIIEHLDTCSGVKNCFNVRQCEKYHNSINSDEIKSSISDDNKYCDRELRIKMNQDKRVKLEVNKFTDKNEFVDYRSLKNLDSLICVLCKKTFRRKSDLTKHLRRHAISLTDGSNFTENGGSEIADTIRNSLVVAKSVEIFDNLTCEFCQRSYDRKSDLTKHLRKHCNILKDSSDFTKDQESMMCEVDAITIHNNLIFSKSFDIDDLTCKLCKRSFSRKSDLTKHLRRHAVSLTDCSNFTEDRGSEISDTIQNNLVVAKSAEIFDNLTCEFCQRSFSRKSDLTKHLRRHAISLTDCTNVTENGGSEISDTIHNSLVVAKSVEIFDNLTCEFCQRSFSRKSDLTKHSRRHAISLTDCTNVTENGGSEISDTIQNSLVAKSVEIFDNLTCEFCQRSFSRKSDLTKHLRRHAISLTDGSNFTENGGSEISDTIRNSLVVAKSVEIFDNLTCKFCHRSYDRKSDLTKHLRKHCNILNDSSDFTKDQESMMCEVDAITIHNNLIFSKSFDIDNLTCKFCERSFSRKSDLTKHLRRHAENCNESSSFVEDGVSETCEVDSDTKNNNSIVSKSIEIFDNLICKFCNRSFSRKSDLTEHLFCHVRNNLNSSKGDGDLINNDNVSDEFDYSDTVEVDESKELLCKNFNSIKTWQINLPSIPEIIKPIPEKKLKKVIKNKENKSPNKESGNKTLEKNLICDHCKKTCCRKSDLIKHLRIHMDDKPYSCKFCGKKFNQISNMQRHVITTHEGEKQYSCGECNKSFTQKSHLEKHLKTHSDIKSFSCKYCLKCFTDNSYLALHLRTHTGSRPFKCKFCKTAFTQAAHLNRHINRIHKKSKQFSCKDCNKTFGTIYNLTLHTRTHNGAKPYSCEECNKSFSQKSHLNTHMRVHANKDINTAMGFQSDR